MNDRRPECINHRKFSLLTTAALFATLLWSSHAPPPVAAEEPQSRRVPLFEGLGDFGRVVTTSSDDAQRYFNQGLSFLFAFNHDEAIRSFRQAAELDPKCAMAWWGIAFANGPHINNPIVDESHAKAAWEALSKAREAAKAAKPIEQALIAALGKRYADPQPADRKPLDEAFAAAMRQLWKDHSDDADIGALFAESLMDLRPWDLWAADGTPQSGTDEIVATLEAVLRDSPNHPLALHLYIHAVEASPDPARADAAAERLRYLQPGLGHLVHMPSHIDVRRGRWRQAVETNARAIESDRKYRERSPEQGFYRIYMAHNHHMLSFAAIMQGQSKAALEAINEMAAGMPPDWVQQNAPLADGFTALPVEVLLRFGRWDEVLAVPEPPAYLPLARALRHYARGVALAAQDKVAEAKVEQLAFREARARVDMEARFGNNAADDLLAVAERLLAGEILYREGRVDEAVAFLRDGVRREDQLRYDEPPDWLHSVRHALGAILLAEKRVEEAETVYREDLQRFPENGWALFGLSRSLRMQGDDAAADEAQTRFEKVWAQADVEITSSCFCQPAGNGPGRAK